MATATTTQGDSKMTTDTNIRPVTAPIIWNGWQDGQTEFAYFNHDGELYSFRIVSRGIDILRQIQGRDCILAQVDTVDEALAFVSVFAGQLI
jgi:hypothetical protein